MTLLEAVNNVLRHAGETQLIELDNTHPQQADIIASIEKVSKRAQARGWWFNSFTRTLEADADSPFQVAVPADSIVVPVSRAQEYITQGGFLFDLRTDDYVTGRSVQVNMITRREFEELPDSFADWVAEMAAFDFITSFEPDSPKLSAISQSITAARIVMNAEHIRNLRINLFQSGTTGQSLAMSYGQRYPIGR